MILQGLLQAFNADASINIIGLGLHYAIFK